MFSSWRRGAGVATIIVVLFLGAAYAFWPKPVPVDLDEVSRGSLEVTVEDEGVTRIREIYMVSAPISGRLLRSPREVGDKVEANKTIVAVIRPSSVSFLNARTRQELEALVRASEHGLKLAEAELQRSKAELAFAETELNRAQRLVKSRTISQRALDQAELNVETKKASVATDIAKLDVRHQELASARARLIEPGEEDDDENSPSCCVEVKAPQTGRVLKILHESEQIVSAGEQLIEIGDPEDLEIVVELLSLDAVKVKPGAKAVIERWGGSGTLLAKVNRIEPSGFKKISALGIEEQRVNVILDIVDSPEKWSRLGHDFRVYVRITIWEGTDVLRVPLSALFRHKDDWAVFVEKEGRARLQKVVIGERNTSHAVVKNGLDEGDRVILHPSDRVSEEVAVVPREEVRE